jgi:thiosulfate dehydrogenase
MTNHNFIFSTIIYICIIAVIGCENEASDNFEINFDKASVEKGGIMYDNFWSLESGFNQNSAQLATLTKYPDFFKCKQCHAWDGLGSSGSYINRAPNINRPTVSILNLFQLAQSKSPEYLFSAIKRSEGRRSINHDLSTYHPINNNLEGNKMPNYSEIMSDEDIWNLVKFLKNGMFDVSELYDADYSGVYPTGKAVYSNIGKNGNPIAGNQYYTQNCASCHGNDGKLIPNLDNTPGMTVGKFARTKPNEMQHKVHYGQLGTAMTGKFNITITQMRDLYKACSNETNFPQ